MRRVDDVKCIVADSDDDGKGVYKDGWKRRIEREKQ